MLRTHMYRILGLLFLGFLVAGCGGAIHNYKAYYGKAKQREVLALIKGEARVEEGFLIDDHIYVFFVAVDDKVTHGLFSGMAQSVLVEPGRRHLFVKYRNGQMYANGQLWLDAAKGKTYIVRSLNKGMLVSFWIEDEETGERVGGISGSEPDNNPDNNKDN